MNDNLLVILVLHILIKEISEVLGAGISYD